jgi:hypothetical protein
MWLRGTRGMEFLMAPTDARLALVRQRVAESIPVPERPGDAVSIPANHDPEKPHVEEKPAVVIGDVTARPRLGEYSEEASKGAEYLTSLALLLETEDEMSRALLAWERILDQCKATPEQATVAISAIQRLRLAEPPWNTKPERATKVLLQIGTSSQTAKHLASATKAAAELMERASSGILDVDVKVNISKASRTKNKVPVPVALWLSGPTKESPSTEVVSLTLAKDDAPQERLDGAIYSLISDYLRRNTTLDPLHPLAENDAAIPAIESRITRLAWRDLGVLLNRKPESKP